MIFIEGMTTKEITLSKIIEDILKVKSDYNNKTGFKPNEIKMNNKNLEIIKSLAKEKEWLHRAKTFEEIMEEHEKEKQVQEGKAYNCFLGMKVIIDNSIEGFEVR